MSVPIIRFGPFINTATNRPANQPATADGSIIPVNCALSDWSNDQWKALVFIRRTKEGFPPEFDTTTQEYKDGPSVIVNANNRFAARSDASSQVRLVFYYQAATDFTLQVDALTSASVAGGGNSAFASFNILVGNNSVFSEADSATSTGTFDQVTPEIRFNQQIVLPASAVPNPVEFNMLSYTNRSGNFGSDVIASLDISPPAL